MSAQGVALALQAAVGAQYVRAQAPRLLSRREARVALRQYEISRRQERARRARREIEIDPEAGVVLRCSTLDLEPRPAEPSAGMCAVAADALARIEAICADEEFNLARVRVDSIAAIRDRIALADARDAELAAETRAAAARERAWFAARRAGTEIDRVAQRCAMLEI